MSRRTFMPPIHKEGESSPTSSRPKPRTSGWRQDHFDPSDPYGWSSSISVQKVLETTILGHHNGMRCLVDDLARLGDIHLSELLRDVQARDVRARHAGSSSPWKTALEMLQAAAEELAPEGRERLVGFIAAACEPSSLVTGPVTPAPALTDGRPLDQATRDFFEPRFGHSFANVRIHDDTGAEQAAADLNARAFTVGQDISFAKGEPPSNTKAGQHLLAHELSHVIQQRAAIPQATMPLPVSSPGAAHEREADRAADAVVDGARYSGSRMQPTAVHIARQEAPGPGTRSNVDVLISFLSAPQEIAGVGDFDGAFRWLNGLSTDEAVAAIAGAADRGYLALMLDNAASAAPYDHALAALHSVAASRAAPAPGTAGRAPDIDRGGFQTFSVDVDRFARVLAFQIGVQPNDRRLSVRLAALAPGLTNPPEIQRTMSLALPASTPRSPRVVSETEYQVDADVYERLITVRLADVEGAPVLNVVARYGRAQGSIPFPDGHVENRNIDKAWMSVSDGVNSISVNFHTEVAGSLFTSEWVPFVHPALGFGYRNTSTSLFVPRPSGDSFSQMLPSPSPEEVARFGIHLIPIAGSLVMAYEAIRGRTIFGRRMSTTERVLLGAGAVLAELGPILRAGQAVVRGADALAAATRLSGVTRLSIAESLRLVYGARVLTAPERETIARLASQVEAGTALSAADQVVVNRLLGKLSEPARALALRAEVEATTGTAIQAGRFTVPAAGRASADEARVGNALARDLNADVVKVPESTVQGVRSGDYLLNGQFAEAYAPQTARLDNILTKASAKHQQAGLMVIDLTRSGANARDVIAAAPRIFGRPQAADLSRIIYVNGDRVVADVARPTAAPLGPDVVEGMFIRGAASAGSQAGRRDGGR